MGQNKALELSQLSVEYGHWYRLPSIESDNYGAYRRLAAIYQFAIDNYEQPGVELLLSALETSDD